MIQFFRFYPHKVYIGLILLLTVLSGYGQTKKGISLVLGSIDNKTSRNEYDNINTSLNRILDGYPLFPETILDTMLSIDSMPDESVILEARNLDASYILWGRIDSSEYGFSINLKVFDMFQASTAHIGILIKGSEKKNDVAEIIRSKLLMWLRRITMAQLIISTTPSAAIILLNDKEIGTTPFEGMVQPGTFSLGLVKKTFSPIKMPVSFICGNTYQYDFKLENSDTVAIKDKRSVIGLLTASMLCAGAGGAAHFFQERAIKQYRNALPPADFDRLYHKAVAWNAGRNTLWAAAGVSLCGMLLKVIF